MGLRYGFSMERRNAGEEAKRSFAQSSFANFSFKKSWLPQHCAAVLLQGLQDRLHVGVRLFGSEAAVVGPEGEAEGTDFLPSGMLAPR